MSDLRDVLPACDWVAGQQDPEPVDGAPRHSPAEGHVLPWQGSRARRAAAELARRLREGAPYDPATEAEHQDPATRAVVVGEGEIEAEGWLSTLDVA